MLVSEYVANYTHDFMEKYGRNFGRVWMEIVELLEELVKLNPKGIKEEFGDVVHLTQLWLYSYGWDGKLWMWCARKFIARQPVWQELFNYVGVAGRPRMSTNYMREEKVIERLGLFGVPEEKAKEAYRVVILKQPK